MTKGQAYKKYGLSLDNVNFNPDEVADERFLRACEALGDTMDKAISDAVEQMRKDTRREIVEKYGEETAIQIENEAFLMACYLNGMPEELFNFIKILLSNGCSVDAVHKGLEYISKYGGNEDD